MTKKKGKKIVVKLLAVGDVINIEKGMMIYVSIPEHYRFDNSKKDTKTTADIKVGDTLLSSRKNVKPLDTMMFAGEYVVIGTHMQGGGTGMGPHDVYPDGHHVTAKRLTQDHAYTPVGEEISFFQSGCFTAMIEPNEIHAIGRMVQQVSFQHAQPEDEEPEEPEEPEDLKDKLPSDFADPFTEFESAAMDWGLQGQEGSRKVANKAETRFNKARTALLLVLCDVTDCM